MKIIGGRDTWKDIDIAAAARVLRVTIFEFPYVYDAFTHGYSIAPYLGLEPEPLMCNWLHRL